MQVGAGARLGGVTSLEVDGLKGFEEPRIHIWVPKSRRKLVPTHDISRRVVLHETRRWVLDDSVEVGLPRSKRAVATMQAALWARSPRQAALCLVMPIQQRLVRADDVALELARVRRHEFRRLLTSVLADIMGGAQSLNELDFAAECRRRGLPEPTRQQVRQLPSGRAYLDVRWSKFRVSLEVNGAGHDGLDVAMRDEVRIAHLQATGDAAIPVSVLTLRVDPEPFFDALRQVLVSRGWRS